MIEFCHDRNCMRIEISQVTFVATNISMSQQTVQPAIRTREEKSVATKEKSLAIEIVKKSKEFNRDIENYVAIK